MHADRSIKCSYPFRNQSAHGEDDGFMTSPHQRNFEDLFKERKFSSLNVDALDADITI